jgi:hypothetical protein
MLRRDGASVSGALSRPGAARNSTTTIRAKHAVPSMLGGRGDYSGRARLWEFGLTGVGELIGLADTGIDFDNCFFSDAASIDQAGFPTLAHRKVPFYRRLRSRGSTSALGDAPFGHGAHDSPMLSLALALALALALEYEH